MAKKEIPLLGCLRLLEPGPVTLVTSQFRGQPNVMTAAWVAPASYAPPMVVVAVHTESHTQFLIGKNQEFVINIPGRPLAEQVMACGALSGRDGDKFARVGLEVENGHRVEVPWVASCLAHLECGVAQAHRAGDHTLYIGEVLGAWAEEAAFDGQWKLEDEEMTPLIHLGGRTFALPGGRFVVREREVEESEA